MDSNPAASSFGDAWLCDLAGRLAFAHKVAPALFASVVGLVEIDAIALEAGEPLALGPDQRRRLELAINILLRLEWRLHADTAEMLAWLQAPNAELAGATPAEAMASSMDNLRKVRRAVDTAAAPEVRWWRVGHNRR